MTLGLFLVIATAITALVEIVVFTGMRNSGKVSEGIYPILVVASLALPLIVYLVMFQIMPETGATILF